MNLAALHQMLSHMSTNQATIGDSIKPMIADLNRMAMTRASLANTITRMELDKDATEAANDFLERIPRNSPALQGLLASLTEIVECCDQLAKAANNASCLAEVIARETKVP